MEQINGWSSATLGDGMWAPTVSAQIEKEFIAAFKAAGSPADMAVFTRREEGELHCEVVAYFSPAAQTLAMRFDTEPCGKPARGGLGLLAGDPRCWAILFPEVKE
ncbi:MAG: hypothetical protein KDD72_00315 [Anaerolineales bacterium]|jgi:hypothetical protein|nr:hypothetical protein [Anaerolineales bacterium]